MAGKTAWILGDQLSHEHPAIEGADRVLLVESEAKLRSGRFHRQKLHLVLVAMRRFAAELRERGIEVDHRRSTSLPAGLEEHASAHAPGTVLVAHPSSRAGARRLALLPHVRVLDATLFLTSPVEFAAWADGRRRLVMEDFYRGQRRRLDVLMDGDEPAGGRWNFDAENREPPPDDRRPPAPWRPHEDAVDDAVRADLDALGLDTFGEAGPRAWPASADEARAALDAFVADRLADFGPWQDAMLAGERLLWHSGLSSSLNLGLLDPRACVDAAEDAYRAGDAPLASVEGFVRQVIGWREYVWGMYWLQDDWAGLDALDADSPLPDALWSGDTDMRCIADAVGGVRATAYAHHIERLMLFGNLMLLLGVSPRAAFDWFHESFIDGYPWVMAPNVLGMATYADGGRMMTKPYAAGGRYVNRMSDHCGDCRYRPTERVGERACPFTTLYWDFMDRNRERLAENPRMRLPLRNLERIDPGDLEEIRARGRALRERFDA